MGQGGGGGGAARQQGHGCGTCRSCQVADLLDSVSSRQLGHNVVFLGNILESQCLSQPRYLLEWALVNLIQGGPGSTANPAGSRNTPSCIVLWKREIS